MAASLAHGASYITYALDPSSDGDEAKNQAFNTGNPTLTLEQGEARSYWFSTTTYTGAAILIVLILITITALPPIRRRSYNLFYYSHIICSIAIFIGASIHASTDFYLLIPGLFLWLVDWSWRLFGGEAGGLSQQTTATLEDAGNGWYRISLPLKRSWNKTSNTGFTEKGVSAIHPLSAYYLNIPAVSRIQNHAFTAAKSTSMDCGPVFLFQRTQGKKQKKLDKEWTWRLGALVTSEKPSTQLKIRVEGPYQPNDEKFNAASHIVCIVGGTGFTGAYSLAIWWLRMRSAADNSRFTLVWTVRHAQMTKVKEWLDLQEAAASTPNLNVVAHISSESGRLDVSQWIRYSLSIDQDGPWDRVSSDLPQTDALYDPGDSRDKHELKSNDPIDVLDYLSQHPDIDVNRWMELSLDAFEAFPKTERVLLRLAVEAGYPSVLEALLEAGANPVIKDKFGDPSSDAVVIASIKGDVESMQSLVRAGVHPDMTLTSNQKLRPGWLGNRNAHARDMMSRIIWRSSPTHIAINNNHTALVQWLLATGRVDLTRRQSGESLPPLEAAILIGHMPTLRVTMEHYAATDDGNYLKTLFDDPTLLVYAAWTGDRDVIHYVINRFISPLEDSESEILVKQLVDKNLPFMVAILESLFSSPRTSPRVIQYFFDYLGQLDHLNVSILSRLQQGLKQGCQVAANTDNIDVFTLLMQLNEQITTHSYAPEERTHHSSEILKESFCWAFAHDSISVVRYLIEEKGVNPDNADSCNLPIWGGQDIFSVWDYKDNTTSPTRSGLLYSILTGNFAVTSYLMTNSKSANISSLNDQAYSWILKYPNPWNQYKNSKPRASLDETKSVLHSLLQRGVSVSHISPPTLPDFRNKQVVVDVMESKHVMENKFEQRRSGVCLCWGYKDTIRPEPQWNNTATVRLDLKEEDSEWWIQLSTLHGVVQEQVVSSEEL
nr:uncharacterized protein CTRU02_10924 [Colletotrichum truncatum]KAF6786426.1 hypothetical protein CTRU02_10924 [Colletotrichum truncatum]